MKKYDHATHKRVFSARREGKTLNEIVAETGVSRSTVKLWLTMAACQERYEKDFSTENFKGRYAICNPRIEGELRRKEEGIIVRVMMP